MEPSLEAVREAIRLNGVRRDEEVTRATIFVLECLDKRLRALESKNVAVSTEGNTFKWVEGLTGCFPMGLCAACGATLGVIRFSNEGGIFCSDGCATAAKGRKPVIDNPEAGRTTGETKLMWWIERANAEVRVHRIDGDGTHKHMLTHFAGRVAYAFCFAKELFCFLEELYPGTVRIVNDEISVEEDAKIAAIERDAISNSLDQYAAQRAGKPIPLPQLDRCRDCKHWGNRSTNAGTCESPSVIVDGGRNNAIFTLNKIVTGPDFGCVHHVKGGA